jgi:hypothetical protein
MHYHKCDQCEHIWRHGDECMGQRGPSLPGVPLSERRIYRLAALQADADGDQGAGVGGSGDMKDVVAVKIESPHTVRILKQNLDENKTAMLRHGRTITEPEAVIEMAVMRRGIETEFYAEVESGAYKDGDEWRGK